MDSDGELQMTMTIPTIPSLPAGHVVTLAEMQELAYAATFLLTKPIVLIEQVASGQAITTSFASLNNFTAGGLIYDTDGMWNSATPSRLTVQTPGWYKVRYAVNVGTNGGTFNTAIRSTTGSNNPLGAGVQSGMYWGAYSVQTATTIPVYCGSQGVWPQYLYAGDYLQILMKAAASGSSTGLTAPGSGSNGGSWFSAELVSI